MWWRVDGGVATVAVKFGMKNQFSKIRSEYCVNLGVKANDKR